jgi:hypothetical protein
VHGVVAALMHLASRRHGREVFVMDRSHCARFMAEETTAGVRLNTVPSSV